MDTPIKILDEPLQLTGIDKVLQAFSFRDLQSAIMIKRQLDKNDISWDDYTVWVKKHVVNATKPLMPMPDAIRSRLDRANLTWDAFTAWLDGERVLRQGNIPIPAETKLCPECNHPLAFEPVNTTTSNQVGGDWTSMWFCDECSYSELNIDKVMPPRPKLVLQQKSRKSKIVRPCDHKMLYYGNKRRTR